MGSISIVEEECGMSLKYEMIRLSLHLRSKVQGIQNFGGFKKLFF